MSLLDGSNWLEFDQQFLISVVSWVGQGMVVLLFNDSEFFKINFTSLIVPYE